MNEEEAIKKLESVSAPEIEILSHKRKLKAILLGNYYNEKKSWKVFSILFKVIPVGSFAILLLIFGISNFFTNYNLARAEEIITNDPQIKALINSGGAITDKRVADGKVYFLVQSSGGVRENTEERTVNMLSAPTLGKIASGGTGAETVLVEVDFKEKKVSKIENIRTQTSSLSEEDKEKIKGVIKESTKIQKTVPEDAEIQDIKPIQPGLKIVRRGNSVDVIPDQKEENKALVTFKQDGNRWEGEIDIKKGSVEKVDFFQGSDN